jgi:hypothetical protein
MASVTGWLGLVCVAAVGCATLTSEPGRTLPMPATVERDRALDELGHRAFLALQRRDVAGLLLGDQALRMLLQPTAASTAAVLRAAPAADPAANPDRGEPMQGCRYRGLCVQRARNEPAGGSLGLREAAFVLDRALVTCEEPGGGRIAAWVEGTFVLTDQGFYAIALQRLESPRRDHSDLDLAPCDFRVEAPETQPVVVSGAESH